MHLPETLPPWLIPLLSMAGLWLFSQFVDALNAVVKKRDADGVPTGQSVRFALATLNVMAGNMLKGKRVVGDEAHEANMKNGEVRP